METYRSGHNGAHSKCVCPPGHEGSNPSVSAQKKDCRIMQQSFLFAFILLFCRTFHSSHRLTESLLPYRMPQIPDKSHYPTQTCRSLAPVPDRSGISLRAQQNGIHGSIPRQRQNYCGSGQTNDLKRIILFFYLLIHIAFLFPLYSSFILKRVCKTNHLKQVK